MSVAVTAVGTIATDPKEIQLSDGLTLCTFRFAVTERRYNREQQTWVDADTNWFSVNVFRTLAVHTLASVAKGQRVFVHGKLRVKPWERDGKSGTSVEIDAESVGHDLRWGTTVFHRDTAHSQTFTPDEAGTRDGANPGDSDPSAQQPPEPGWGASPLNDTSSLGA